MFIRRITAVLFVLALAAVGCGDSDNSNDVESSAGDSEVTTKEASDARVVNAAIDAFEQRARADGYVVDPEEDDSDDDFAFESEECKQLEEAFPGEEDDLPGQTADRDSDSFTRGEFDARGGVTELLEGSAALVEKSSDLDLIFDLFRDERMQRCLDEALRAGFAEGAEDEEVTIEDVTLDVADVEGVGDDAVAIRMSANINASGLKFPFVLDFEFARLGRAAAFVGATTIGGQDIRAPLDELVRSVLEDLQAAA